MPDILELQAKARAWGIRADSPVVVYDNAGGAQASRAWWTLRWAGLANVRVEDIVERVGVSRRTFSNYYASKEDAIVDRHHCPADNSCRGATDPVALASESPLSRRH